MREGKMTVITATPRLEPEKNVGRIGVELEDRVDFEVVRPGPRLARWDGVRVTAAVNKYPFMAMLVCLRGIEAFLYRASDTIKQMR